MFSAHDFAPKLDLVLKALSISRGRLAADVGVDKSLVGRWCSGSIKPSAHNLTRLSQVIAARFPGFSMHDWDLDLQALAARFGVTVQKQPSVGDVPSGIAEWLSMPKLREAALASGATTASIAGFWRTTRPSPELPGKFVHNNVIMQPTPDGPLSFRMGLFAVRVLGWAVAVGDQLFCCASNQMTGTSVFAILNRVHQPRVDVMDGITLACMTDAGGVPTAGPIVMERIGDLTGDADADLARYEASLSDHPIAAEGSIAEHIRDHIFFDVGPAAMNSGGDPVFMMRAMTSLSRGGPLDMQCTSRLRAVS